MFGTTSRIDTELVERHGKKGLSQGFFFKFMAVSGLLWLLASSLWHVGSFIVV